MKGKSSIIFSDIFFYGLSLRSKDTTDVRSDIFANILKKYLTSLKPVSNKLYRASDNEKYEYSYTFAPSKPLSWRVIRNRRVVEDIEQLSDGKYCLNYYDDNGDDVKRIIFNAQHKWVKTNYYNSVNGANLFCSLVPKEDDGKITILQYVTGVPYPVTLRCCPAASCGEVLDNVLQRVPEPEVMALTNYGILYFACEETYNIFVQVLAQEEDNYALAHKPEVYTTQEDVASGFCFSADSFDTTKNNDSLLDLSLAQELTSDNFGIIADETIPEIVEERFIEQISLESDGGSDSETEYELPSEDNFSLNEQLAAAIKLISETTNISIDEELVFNQKTTNDMASVDNATEEVVESVIDVIVDDNPETEFEQEEIIIPDDDLDNVIVEIDDVVDAPVIDDDNFEKDVDIELDDISSDDSTRDLLLMDDEAIDDYVSNLIDSILLEAHSTASDYLIQKQESFVSSDTEASLMISDNNPFSCFIEENAADVSIESNGLSYFYYGETNSDRKRHGRGRTLMSDGKTAYDGEYYDDARHGKGSFYYKDGSLCYYGNWENNLRQGFGVGISSETGINHIGNWSQNKPCGVGVRFSADGKFMYLDSACERTNGGIRITGFTQNSVFIEFWDEKSLKIIKREISVEDLLK